MPPIKVSYTDEHGKFRVTEPCVFPDEEAAKKGVPEWASNLVFIKLKYHMDKFGVTKLIPAKEKAA